jgi:hypothetical protein
VKQRAEIVYLVFELLSNLHFALFKPFTNGLIIQSLHSQAEGRYGCLGAEMDLAVTDHGVGSKTERN